MPPILSIYIYIGHLVIEMGRNKDKVFINVSSSLYQQCHLF